MTQDTQSFTSEEAIKQAIIDDFTEDDLGEEIYISPLFPEPLNSLLGDAVKSRATDIHIDPIRGGDIVVRFRVDGIVQTHSQLRAEMGQRLVNQIKIASQIDIERHFSPMESQLQWVDENGPRDVRVVLTPAGRSESLHLRFITLPDNLSEFNGLDLSEQHQQEIRESMESPYGLIIVAGATGAGKSSTLYSLASMLDLKNKVGISIEDPVEFDLPYLRQIQVDEEHGLSMYEGLRVILRMDPDVILVGEVRDKQSAITAARAAMAGRLVIATIHATDAAASVEALHYLSVPYYIIGSTLRQIISQNLIRRLCMECSRPREVRDVEKSLFESYNLVPPKQVYEPVGCPECGSYGYSGRMGIFETVKLTPQLAELISNGASQDQIREAFRASGSHCMEIDALNKAACGMTSMDEVRQACWMNAEGMAEELIGQY